MAFRKTILQGASEDRLERLIESRLLPNADKKKIDRRIWDLFGEEFEKQLGHRSYAASCCFSHSLAQSLQRSRMRPM